MHIAFRRGKMQGVDASRVIGKGKHWLLRPCTTATTLVHTAQPSFTSASFHYPLLDYCEAYIPEKVRQGRSTTSITFLNHGPT